MSQEPEIQEDALDILEPWPDLEPRQAQALGLLIAGNTLTEAAASTGVSRQTIYRWARYSEPFKKAYNRARSELREAVRNRLLTMAQDAARTVEAAIRDGDARIALEILKGIGELDGKRPLVEPDSEPEDDPSKLSDADIARQLDEIRQQTEQVVARRLALSRPPEAGPPKPAADSVEPDGWIGIGDPSRRWDKADGSGFL